MDELDKVNQAIDKYDEAVKPLTRNPKDMQGWLRTWETAVLKAQDSKLPGIDNSHIWWRQFDKAVRPAGYGTWCDSFQMGNRELITAIFERERRKIQEGDIQASQWTISRGSFLTFGGMSPEREASDTDHPRNRSGKRKAAEEAKGSRSKRQKKEAKCPLCNEPHSMERCFAEKKPIRPKNFRDSKLTKLREALAEERLINSQDLRDQLETIERRERQVRFADKDVTIRPMDPRAGHCLAGLEDLAQPNLSAGFAISDYPLRDCVILDSGSTTHVFNIKDRFMNYKRTTVSSRALPSSSQQEEEGAIRVWEDLRNG